MSSPNIENVINSLDEIDIQSLGDNAHVGSQLIEAARRMIARLEPPFNQVFYNLTVPVHVTVALRIISDLGLWKAWCVADGKEATLMELRRMCKVACDLVVLRRLLMLITASNFLVEVGEDCWRPTPTSLALGDEESPAYNCMVTNETQILPSARNLPKFLAKTKYAEPNDPINSNYADLTPEKLTFFERMTVDPLMNKSFSGLMTGFNESRLDWTEIYNIEILLDGFDFGDTSKKLLVDIGGSHGMDLRRIIAKKPDIPPGFLVLQELFEVVANAPANEKIELMPYNFFTEQTVVGSRAYLLRAVLHDWDDTDATRILQRVGAAMTRGYSTLLICDVVLPPVGAQLYQAVSDFLMMHLNSSSDRTEKRWLNLLHGVGLEVKRIWRHPASSDSIFEVVLAGSDGGEETMQQSIFTAMSDIWTE